MTYPIKLGIFMGIAPEVNHHKKTENNFMKSLLLYIPFLMQESVDFSIETGVLNRNFRIQKGNTTIFQRIEKLWSRSPKSDYINFRGISACMTFRSAHFYVGILQKIRAF